MIQTVFSWRTGRVIVRVPTQTLARWICRRLNGSRGVIYSHMRGDNARLRAAIADCYRRGDPLR